MQPMVCLWLSGCIYYRHSSPVLRNNAFLKTGRVSCHFRRHPARSLMSRLFCNNEIELILPETELKSAEVREGWDSGFESVSVSKYHSPEGVCLSHV